MTMEKYYNIKELNLKERRVFVRVDFNVPLKEGPDGQFNVRDATRIVGALDTIRYVVAQGGKCILASHLGRPKGKPEKKYSMIPVGQKLSELLKKEVIVTEDCVGDGPKSLSHRMRAGDVMLLENLRFHAGEEGNAVDFINDLAKLCDVYVSDAFGTLHRAHASTEGLPRVVKEKGLGFLVERELQFLQPLRDNPKKPFGLVMGGVKVSDKMGVLEHFVDKASSVFIGGAMAYAFLKARGKSVGKSLCEASQVELASKLLKMAEARNVSVFLPVDHVVTPEISDTKNVSTTSGEDVPDGMMGVDIGPKTVQKYRSAMSALETLFWNGPMGVFEEPAFANGTFELAKVISSLRALKLAGGGDVAAALEKSGCAGKFDFISTGGGATLEYLEGIQLPGLKVMEVSKR